MTKTEWSAETADISVRAHLTYSVNRYTSQIVEGGNMGKAGSEQIASGLTAHTANEIASALSLKHPNARLATMECEERIIPSGDLRSPDNLYGAAYQWLRMMRQGSRLSFRLERGDLVVDYAIASEWEPKHYRPLHAVGRRDPVAIGEGVQEPADYTDTNWLGGLMWGEVGVIKRHLRSMPHIMASAVRRNARAADDLTMLRLMDEAKVAVDA